MKSETPRHGQQCLRRKLLPSLYQGSTPLNQNTPAVLAVLSITAHVLQELHARLVGGSWPCSRAMNEIICRLSVTHFGDPTHPRSRAVSPSHPPASVLVSTGSIYVLHLHGQKGPRRQANKDKELAASLWGAGGEFKIQ